MKLATIKTKLAKPALAWTQSLVLASAGVLPMLNAASVSAQQLTTRKMSTSTSVGGDISGFNSDAATHTFEFEAISASSTLQSIEFLYCTTAIGTCTAPTGLDLAADDIDGTPLTIASDTGDETGWAEGTHTTNKLQVTRTDAVDVDAATATDRQVNIAFDNITNPDLEANAYVSYYVRVTTYTDTAYTTVRAEGTVAQAITQQLTITGRVAERLEFCVAALTSGTSPADCDAFPTDTNVDIGVIDDDETDPARSPEPIDAVNPALGGNNKYGAALIDTNAGGGATISYFVEADAGGTNQTRNFRIDDASCNAVETTETDQCFQSAAVAGTDFSVSADERFGMHVACAKPATGASNTDVLVTVAAAYDADASDATCEDTEADDTFAWNNTGNAVELANSGGNLVNDEIIHLGFGAVAAATTPTGSYTVTTTYVASATF